MNAWDAAGPEAQRQASAIAAQLAAEANANDRKSAPVAYAYRKAQVLHQLGIIVDGLARHQDNQAAQPGNWGFAGDLGQVAELLDRVIGSLPGDDDAGPVVPDMVGYLNGPAVQVPDSIDLRVPASLSPRQREILDEHLGELAKANADWPDNAIAAGDVAQYLYETADEAAEGGELELANDLGAIADAIGVEYGIEVD
jgi:hypothetical protein